MNLERGGRLGKGLQRNEPCPGLRVVEDRVTLAERSALDVLARQSDRNAIGEDAGKGKVLGGRPVDGPLVRIVEHRLAALPGALQFLVEDEPGRRCLQPFIDLPQALEWNRGLRPRSGARRCWFWHRRLEILFRLQ